MNKLLNVDCELLDRQIKAASSELAEGELADGLLDLLCELHLHLETGEPVTLTKAEP